MNNNEKEVRGLKRKMSLGEKIKCVFWSIAVLLFSFWMSSAWPLLALLYVVDLYWMHYVPWDWLYH